MKEGWWMKSKNVHVSGTNKNEITSQPKRNNSLTIPIVFTSENLVHLATKKAPEHVKEIKIEIDQSTMEIRGIIKKYRLSMHFVVSLKPHSVSGRKLSFSVQKIRPFHNDWLDRFLFHRPPRVTYKNSVVTIDLNTIDRIRKLPFGTIKDMVFKEEKVLVYIGL